MYVKRTDKAVGDGTDTLYLPRVQGARRQLGADHNRRMPTRGDYDGACRRDGWVGTLRRCALYMVPWSSEARHQ